MGVFADSAQQPRWIVEALAKVASSDFAEIVVVCVENRGQTTVSHGAERVFRDSENRGLSPVFSLYALLDRKLFGGSNWTEPCNVERLVPASRRQSLETLRSEDGSRNLDVAFAVGAIDDAALEGLAKCGTWRYCFGDGHGTCEPLAGIREVIDAAPVTSSGIRIHLGAGLPDRVAAQSWSRTLPFSVARSRDNLFAKTTEFLPRALRDLHSTGLAWLERETVPARPREEQPPVGTVADASRVSARVARRAAEKILTVEQWSLAFRFADIESWSGSLEGFFRLEPPKDRFWADPFPVQRGDKSYIFFEELPFATGKAYISMAEVDRQGRASEPTRVLERDYHLSYPFLVEEGGQLYMVPETAQNGTVEIYRCADFPSKWRRERVLLDGLFAVDATLHRADSRWWMFANVTANGAEVHDELHLFSAETLLGEWKPHRRNPVKSDVRSARPAGRLFTQGGRLYRPSQICAPLYGTGVSLNRVTRLDDDGFTEEEERRIVPPQGSGVLGLHTINRAVDLSVIDVFARRSRF